MFELNIASAVTVSCIDPYSPADYMRPFAGLFIGVRERRYLGCMDHEPIPSGIVRAAGEVSVDLAALLETVMCPVLGQQRMPVASAVVFLQTIAGLLTDEISNPYAFTRTQGQPRGAPVATAAYLDHVHALGPDCPAYNRIDWGQHKNFKL